MHGMWRSHLESRAVGVLGQVALPVAHQVAALVEGQAVDVQLVPAGCRSDRVRPRRCAACRLSQLPRFLRTGNPPVCQCEN